MNDISTIMLIRHAERPGDNEFGLTRQGQADPQSLSVTGWMRAGALVRLFTMLNPRCVEPHLARPRHLVVARDTPQRQTLQPLAEALGLTLDERWSADDPLPALALHLRGLEGPVLVCWRHDTLPALANELLQRPEAPARWPDGCHDLVWVVEQQRLSWTLAQVPQRLLPGDATQGIGRRVKARA